MAFTKKSLEEKLAGLKQQQEQAIQQINLIQGAILFCEQMLKDEETLPPPTAKVILSEA